jgi:leucyl/phenylalanyl-tRNA---protein transferase
MRQGRYTVTFDQDFEGVIKARAAKREGHYRITWITPWIMHADAKLFDAGYVHSFEVWNGDGVAGAACSPRNPSSCWSRTHRRSASRC